MSVAYELKKCYNFDFRDKVFLECGACADGEETSEFMSQNECFYLEPVPDYYNRLITKKNPLNTFNLGLSNATRNKVRFLNTSIWGNGSINHADEHISELVRRNSHFTEIEIDTITYKEFLQKINKIIDVLVLDVEGHEEAILETFFDLSENEKPKIIVIECGYTWKKKLVLLKKLGYSLDFYVYNNAYCSLSSFYIEKNMQEIQHRKEHWSTWTWEGKVIYDHTDT